MVVGKSLEEMLRRRVGLPLEPMEGGKDEECGATVKQTTKEQDVPTPAQEPDGAWKHDEYAEPDNLTNGSAQCVGERGEGKPGEDGPVGLGLESPQAGVETQDNAKEPADIRHETDRKGQEERTENKSEGPDGCIARVYPRSYERTVGEKCREESDNQRGGTDGGERRAEKLDEEGAQMELPAQHRGAPAVIDDVAGLGEDASGLDIGPVVVHSDLSDGVGGERTEKEQRRRRGVPAGVSSKPDSCVDPDQLHRLPCTARACLSSEVHVSSQGSMRNSH